MLEIEGYTCVFRETSNRDSDPANVALQDWWCSHRRSRRRCSEGTALTIHLRCNSGWPSPFLQEKSNLWGPYRIKLIWKIQMRLSEGQRSLPSSGLMTSWKNSGQLTTTTSPTLAACQQVRLSHIHGHTEEKTPKSDYRGCGDQVFNWIKPQLALLN